MILALLFVVFVALIVWGYTDKKSAEAHNVKKAFGFGGFGLLLFVWLIIFIGNINGAGTLRHLGQRITDAYDKAHRVAAMSLSDADVDKIAADIWERSEFAVFVNHQREHGTIVAITTLDRAIYCYNAIMLTRQAYAHGIWLVGFVPPLPKEIRPLSKAELRQLP